MRGPDGPGMRPTPRCRPEQPRLAAQRTGTKNANDAVRFIVSILAPGRVDIRAVPPDRARYFRSLGLTGKVLVGPQSSKMTQRRHLAPYHPLHYLTAVN
jgi:hypothetical protein